MSIQFEGKTFELLPDETLLEGIERQGLSLPSFCRSGVCQACVVKATRGDVPALAQRGLKDGERRQGLLMACVCKPVADLVIERQGHAESFRARVEHVERLADNVLQVMLSAPDGFAYDAGQFVQLERPSDGLMRPYSVASLPGSRHLELHVALLPGGAMSGWLCTAAGQWVTLRGPFGQCFYLPDEPDRPLLLAGTGTGLAPLLGVLRAALAAGHRAPIRLFHGSTSARGLYMWSELRALLARAPALSVTGSVLSSSDGAGLTAARSGHEQHGRCQLREAPLDELVMEAAGSLREERVYLCGNPELVKKLQKKLYLAGASLQRIHSDPFVAPAARA